MAEEEGEEEVRKRRRTSRDAPDASGAARGPMAS